MASAPSTTNGKAGVTATKRAALKTAAVPTAATKAKPPKRRVAARPKSSTARKPASSSASRRLPQWITVGASITGALVAVGATLFATRAEWLPRAKKLTQWVEGSLHDQLDSLTVVKSNAVDAALKLKASMPSFELPGTNRTSPADHSTAQ